MTAKPQRYSQVEKAVEDILEALDGNVVLGLPLALGKPVQFANALYRRAKADPGISLTIYTALSLGRPRAGTDLEKRFLEPFSERVFGDYEELEYLTDLSTDRLPGNVQVHEFYFRPGALLRNQTAQQNYISSNYTLAARDLNATGINVLAQMVASRGQGDEQSLSLSCNPELTLDLLPMLDKRKNAGEKIFLVAQVHRDLPFMINDAEFSPDLLDILIDDERGHQTLFSTPNMPVEMTDYFVGLNTSTLIKDGGTLQIGIGALGDALVYSTLLRHQENHHYRALLDSLSVHDKWGGLIDREGGDGVFEKGLYGCSEMFINGFIKLIQAGIIKRRVFDDPEVQRRVNNGEVDPNTLEGGILMHGGFYLGPADFYQALREMEPELAASINMTRISFVNHLYGGEEIKRLQRTDGRFVNTIFTATLLGAAASDMTEEGLVISGVGGQYNFVSQAQELEGGRSILMLRSTREREGHVSSNILMSYGHNTIPRHLRDIVVTEYGIADLRGKCDADVIAAMLNVADSRFQDDLLHEAIAARKIRADYEIPEIFRHNTPTRLQAVYDGYQRQGMFPMLPFGSDFTYVEERLLPALGWLKEKTQTRNLLKLARATLRDSVGDQRFKVHLERMGLENPSTLKEEVYQRLLHTALAATEPSD